MAFSIIYHPNRNVKRDSPTHGGLAFFMNRKNLTKNLKMLFGAYHFVFNSQEIDDIASVINLAPQRVEKLMQTHVWLEIVAYWNGNPRGKEGDLGLAERVWSEMVEFDEHTFPSEFPDVIFNIGRVFSEPPTESIKNNALEMRHYKPNDLIAQPFVVEGLCEEQIRDRIAEERDFGYTPVKYEKQHLQGYYWWLYPNWDAGVFSKIFARANMFGDLVVGAGEKTHLVCIEDGRLTLTRQVSDDVANVSDKRLLVCL